jgi:multidrug transporter EmrE-like cation transporter
MAWFVLFLAGLCEVSWAVGLKYTDGFSRIWPPAGTLAAMGFSVALLGTVRSGATWSHAQAFGRGWRAPDLSGSERCGILH